ncbi:MAG: response regulator [Candidatus Dadabacteria bacterium]|nr:MAG: response regulator [Candidatus Dadabacteria bacterium]
MSQQNNELNISTSLHYVILVDDEESVLLALKLLLKAIGFEVSDFNNGQDALDSVKNGNSCDLFICDLKMPGLNGIDTLRGLKKIASEIPFILMSGHANSEDVQRARDLGASGFLAKPFTPEDLKKVINELEVTH